MPQVAAAAAAVVSYVGSAFAASAAGTATLAQLATVVAVNTAASAAASAVATMAAKPDMPANVIATEWMADPNAPIPVIAGRFKAPGNIVYRQSFGPERMYRGIVGVWSVGPIEAVEEITLDSSVVTFDVNQMANSPIGDKAWFSYRTGLWADTALASPPNLRGSVDIPEWGSNHRLPCLASYMLTLGHDAKGGVWTAGEPEFASIIKGAWAYDPRLDGTYPGGSGSHRRDDPSTWEYTENPGLWALKWVMGVWMGPNGGEPHNDTLALGMGMPFDDIIWEDFVEAANVADALDFTCAGRPTSDDDKQQVLKAFLQAAGAAPRTINGKQGCAIRAASKVSLLTLTEDDIAGDFELTRYPARLERVNTVIPRYRSEDHDWEMVTAEAVTRSTYVTEDGERRRSRQVDYHFVTDLDQAAILAAYDVADSREGWTGAIPCMPWLRDLEPGDCFTVDADVEVIGGVKFLILTRDFDVTTGLVTLGVRAETDSKHVWAGGITGSVTDPTTYDPPDLTFPAPDSGSWALAAVIGEVPGLVVVGAEDNPLARSLIVDYRLDGDTDWTSWTEVGADSEIIDITGLLAGADYEVSLRWRSDRTGAPGSRLILGPETTGGIVVIIDDLDPPDPGTLDDWNVLRRTGGGVFTGSLAATEGADWGTNLSGRPTWATDGRVPAGLDSSGDLIRDITTARANSSNLARRMGGGLLDDLADLDPAASSKLGGIEAGAQVNPADLAALDTTAASKLAGIAAGATVGSARGSYADEATAIAASLLDGDTFYDEDKAVQKAKVGGSIVRVSPLAIYGRDLSQADTDANYSASMPGTAVYSLTLPSTTDADEFEARIHLTLQTGSPHTRGSASTAANVPILWELWCIPPTVHAFKVHEGAFTAEVRIPGGGTASAREVVAWDGDLSVNGYSSFGDEFAFPEAGVHVLELRIHSQTSGNNLLDFTAAIEAKVFHFS